MVSLPVAAWVAERLVGSLVMLLALWALRTCWRSARANQKLSLSDFSEFSARNRAQPECRGLLLPIGKQVGSVVRP